MHYATRLWVFTPRHLAHKVGDARKSSSNLLLIGMVHVVEHTLRAESVEMREEEASSAP